MISCQIMYFYTHDAGKWFVTVMFDWRIRDIYLEWRDLQMIDYGIVFTP